MNFGHKYKYIGKHTNSGYILLNGYTKMNFTAVWNLKRLKKNCLKGGIHHQSTEKCFHYEIMKLLCWNL